LTEFSKVLVANRGEIAVRVLRALKELGITGVAVYSDADAEAPHVERADEAVRIGPGPVAQSYLNAERILDAARAVGADAIHPGYGFFAENAAFARACAEAGITFVGPSPEAIEAMGVKTRARQIMEEAGVPVVPGTITPLGSADEALRVASAIGFPVAFKTAGGGGGKGFHVARDAGEASSAWEKASREGTMFFANGDVYVEEYLESPRHVEVQVLGDSHGTVVHLYERDCTTQRRHQKIVEEAPAPTLSPELRERIARIAVDAARAVGYTSAGTVEGLVAGGRFYFLEMNTRLQVEHPITEMVTGIDLVREQLLVAMGERISFAQEDVRLHGHAIECRVNAEAAHLGFVPMPGKITRYEPPGGPWVRVDSGIRGGYVVPPFYDSLLAKVSVWAEDRGRATARMLRALDEFHLEGVATLLPFHRAYLRTREWREAEPPHALLANEEWLASLAPEPVAV
jgi:acetyl-CoA carboxylase biotin carboxylase subunit